MGTAPQIRRWKVLNPASMKQALVEGAVRLPELNLYEQVRPPCLPCRARHSVLA